MPAVGAFEEALLGGDGAGEGPLHVAEQLALEQRLGQRAAVDRDKGTIARASRWCSARATSSLPVPLSPVMSTVLVVRATDSTRLNTASIGELRPMMPAKRAAR